MKLSVVTVTCRTNPRLSEAARTLFASARKAGVQLDWIIVDEKRRQLHDLIDTTQLQTVAVEPPALRRTQVAIDNTLHTTDRMAIAVVPPLPSSARSGADKTPAHNSARAAGLAEVTGEYVVFLNDCNVVTIDFCAVAKDCAARGVGWKVKTHQISDMQIPADGVLRYRDHHDLLRTVPHMTVAGPCWGVPTAKLAEIGGFDLAYDGQKKGSDLDAIIRLARTGLAFVTTERAFTVQLKRTKNESEITTSKEALASARNQKLLNQLANDKTRILPAGGATFGTRTTRAALAAAAIDQATAGGATSQASPVWDTLVHRTGSGPAPAGGAPAPDHAEAVVAATANAPSGVGDVGVSTLSHAGQLAKDPLYETFHPTSADGAIVGDGIAKKLPSPRKDGSKYIVEAPGVQEKIDKLAAGVLPKPADPADDLDDLTGDDLGGLG